MSALNPEPPDNRAVTGLTIHSCVSILRDWEGNRLSVGASSSKHSSGVHCFAIFPLTSTYSHKLLSGSSSQSPPTLSNLPGRTLPSVATVASLRNARSREALSTLWISCHPSRNPLRAVATCTSTKAPRHSPLLKRASQSPHKQNEMFSSLNF